MSSENLTTVKIDSKGFGQRLRSLRDGLSLEAFGRKIGVSAPAVKNYEAGRIPDAEILLNIAVRFGKSIPWLLTGEELSVFLPEHGAVGSRVAESGAVYEVLKVEDKQDRLPGLEKAEIQLVRVPILEDRIAAGPGRSLDFGRIEDWARVPRWKLKRGNSYYMLRVTGDSMEPQLRAGDLILVNLTRRDPNRLKEKIVAAWLPDEEGATVKLLREDKAKKSWLLHPRNEMHAVIVVPKDQEGFQVAAVEAAWLNFE